MSVFVVNVHGLIVGVFATRELAEIFVKQNYVIKTNTIPFVEEWKVSEN